MESEIVDIVNEENEVVGQGSRQELHEKGLWHRVVNVWFYNANGEVFFQKRSKIKNGSHVSLGFTVGGHVGARQTIMDAVLRETKEETGRDIVPEELTFHGVFDSELTHYTLPETARHKNFMYSFYFTGDASDLLVEEGQAEGFECWNIETVLSLPENERAVFGRLTFLPEVKEFLKEILTLSKEKASL